MNHSPAWIRSLGPLVVADLRHRYAGSALGALWTVLGPLVEVVAYTAVFSLFVKPKTPGEGLTFTLFIASGILPWASLREALEGSAAALPDNRWIRRSRVPMDLLVARQVVAASARGAVGLTLVLAVVVARGGSPGWAGILLPLVGLYLQTAASYGLGVLAAPLATLHPDLRPGLASGLTLLTFGSPILFPEALLQGPVLALMEWNPFTHFLRLYRFPLDPLGTSLGWTDVAVSLATPVAFMALGTLVKDRLFAEARDLL